MSDSNKSDDAKEAWKAAIRLATDQVAEEEKKIRQAKRDLEKAEAAQHAVMTVLGRLEAAAP